MITISTDSILRKRFFCESFKGKIKFQNAYYRHHPFLSVVSTPLNRYHINTPKPNQISILYRARDNVDRRLLKIRDGFCVDNRIPNLPDFNNFCFTTNDFCNIPYLIPAPFGPRFGDNTTIENQTFNNKVFWCGGLTHSTRKDFLSFYDTIDDERFNVSLFNQKVYKDGFKAGTYEAFLDNLSKSDIVFLIRGDRIWAHTFYDIIRSGCIPVMISSMNYYGWENIFKNVDDYMLRFDLREHTMEYIHQQVVSLIEDRERVLYMKANIRRFHDMFFKHDCAKYGFSEFMLAKCIEIYKNDFDINKIDDKFICPEILNLKELGGKI